MSKPLLIVVAGLLALVACKPGVPSEYIQPDDMEDILYDYHIGQAIAQLEDADATQRDHDRLLNLAAVLKKHGVTRAEFDSSLVFYYTRADRFEAVYKRVAERLSEAALDMGATEGEIERYGRITAGGDTASVWEGNKTAVLVPYAPYNRMDFHQKVDTTYRKGDSFLMNVMVDYMYQTGSKDAVVCLSLRFDNDSVYSRVNHVTVSGLTQLHITNNDTLHALKDIYGYVYLGKGNDQSATLKLMFLRNIQLIRFHRQKPKEAEMPKDTVSQVSPNPEKL